MNNWKEIDLDPLKGKRDFREVQKIMQNYKHMLINIHLKIELELKYELCNKDDRSKKKFQI